MTNVKTIFIYNENCAQAGKQVSRDRIEQSSDPDGCWDWTEYDVSEEEAAHQESRKCPFSAKVARTIREALKWM